MVSGQAQEGTWRGGGAKEKATQGRSWNRKQKAVTLRKTIELLSSYIQHRVTDCLLCAGDCALGKLACHH